MAGNKKISYHEQSNEREYQAVTEFFRVSEHFEHGLNTHDSKDWLETFDYLECAPKFLDILGMLSNELDQQSRPVVLTSVVVGTVLASREAAVSNSVLTISELAHGSKWSICAVCCDAEAAGKQSISESSAGHVEGRDSPAWWRRPCVSSGGHSQHTEVVELHLDGSVREVVVSGEQ